MSFFSYPIVWLPSLLAAIGVGLLAHTGLDALHELFQRGLRRRLALAVMHATRSARTESCLPSEAELYGLPHNLVPAMIGAALAGLIISMLALQGPAQVLGLVAGIAPIVWRQRRLAQARLQVRRQVAELIEDVRLRLAFSGSLGAVLYAITDEPERRGVVYDRLRLHRDRIALENPEEVLKRLSEELRSRELKMLMARVRASRLGGVSYTEALRVAADDVSAEIVRQIEADVEGAPLRLVFPMLILLLPPILALALYPPASVLLNALTGAGSSGVLMK
jgi:tight adherence protein C